MGRHENYQLRDPSDLDDRLTTSSDTKMVVRPRSFLRRCRKRHRRNSPAFRGPLHARRRTRRKCSAAQVLCRERGQGRDLYGSCDSSQPNKGIVYSKRFDIEDQRALAYVLEQPAKTCESDCETEDGANEELHNADVLGQLRAEYGAGRKLEPLVLRASAGQCLYVALRNLLPAQEIKKSSPKILTELQPTITSYR